uniref:Uncharacterized protein n=1 Tax=Arundo donax TaxID=35708 RepID=A0A0A9GYJ2_ARUDO
MKFWCTGRTSLPQIHHGWILKNFGTYTLNFSSRTSCCSRGGEML